MGNTTDINSATRAPVGQSLRIEVPAGQPLGVISAPRKNGFAFQGWSTTNSSSDIVNSSTVINSDTTLHAIWELMNPALDTSDLDIIVTSSGIMGITIEITGIPEGATAYYQDPYNSGSYIKYENVPIVFDSFTFIDEGNLIVKLVDLNGNESEVLYFEVNV